VRILMSIVFYTEGKSMIGRVTRVQILLNRTPIVGVTRCSIVLKGLITILVS